MRGIAAMAVVTYHVDLDFGEPRWFPSAYLAVDLFFVLSGFVLAHAYEHRFASGMTTWQFMLLRLIRLYPLYLLALFVPLTSLLAADLAGHDVRISLHSVLSALPWNILFLPAPAGWRGTTPLFPINSAAWSLLFELLVNFLFVATWRFLTNRVLMLAIGLSGFGLIACTYYFGPLEGGWNGETLLVGAARVLYSFPIGVLLYRTRRHHSVPPFNPLIPLIGTALLLKPPYAWGFMPGLYSLFAVVVLSPALVAVGASANVKSVTGKAVCILLGTVSYGVYVLHLSISFLFLRSCELIFGSKVLAHGDAMTTFFIVTMFILIVIVDRLYDTPARTWLSRFASRKIAAKLKQHEIA